jgi:integrase/recombinase XerD
LQVREAQREFLRYITEEKGFGLNTQLAYQHDTNRLVQYLEKENIFSIKEIDRFHLSDFIRSIENEGLAVTSRARTVATLKSFFKYLFEKQIISQNPTSFITQPKIPLRLPQYLSTNESRMLLRAILRTASPWYQMRDYCIGALFLNTGLRLSELCNIKLTDLNPEEKSIRIIRKGNKEAYIYYDNDTAGFLKRWIQFRTNYKEAASQEHLFLSKWGRPICVSTVIEMVKKYSTLSGIVKNGARPFTPHKLRHSFATRLLSNGENIRVVQELLGHKSVVSTQIYTHVSKSALKETIEKQHL